MKRLFTILSIFLMVSILFSFSPPVDSPRVSATFGEYRGSGNRGPHFHMGIDFSTGLKEGEPIYAAERGWLVRIEIDEDDIYGYTVVLEHENGYRTLYAHLSKFAKRLELIVDSLKQEFGNVRIVVKFPEKEIWFEKGEVIGYSGTTGEAPIPHAHFEIRDKDEEISYDPSNFLNLPKPIDEDIRLEKLKIGDDVYDFAEGRTYPFKGNFPALSIKAYSKGFNNTLGLKSISLFLEDEEIYRISFDKIPWSEFTNAWAVYDRKSISEAYRFELWYKLFPETFSSLVKVNKFPETGEFPDFARYKIVLEDIWGMKKEYSFYLQRR
ncbi:M23 family metallopeptidase [Thermotoga sp. KOL6]|uniref:M23 family metallopeptidase n=1 Tax=Thermotoga sp. KOL6 TaxID=126741 RepID=UPI000C771669|nr:M23 family metallopeptidase [Thermotoga sp. KOL6]PLV60319.1 peptidase M23 [Thermotoga sp. KOL6]